MNTQNHDESNHLPKDAFIGITKYFNQEDLSETRLENWYKGACEQVCDYQKHILKNRKVAWAYYLLQSIHDSLYSSILLDESGALLTLIMSAENAIGRIDDTAYRKIEAVRAEARKLLCFPLLVSPKHDLQTEQLSLLNKYEVNRDDNPIQLRLGNVKGKRWSIKTHQNQLVIEFFQLVKVARNETLSGNGADLIYKAVGMSNLNVETFEEWFRLFMEWIKEITADHPENHPLLEHLSDVNRPGSYSFGKIKDKLREAFSRVTGIPDPKR